MRGERAAALVCSTPPKEFTGETSSRVRGRAHPRVDLGARRTPGGSRHQRRARRRRPARPVSLPRSAPRRSSPTAAAASRRHPRRSRSPCSARPPSRSTTARSTSGPPIPTPRWRPRRPDRRRAAVEARSISSRRRGELLVEHAGVGGRQPADEALAEVGGRGVAARRCGRRRARIRRRRTPSACAGVHDREGTARRAPGAGTGGEFAAIGPVGATTTSCSDGFTPAGWRRRAPPRRRSAARAPHRARGESARSASRRCASSPVSACEPERRIGEQRAPDGVAPSRGLGVDRETPRDEHRVALRRAPRSVSPQARVDQLARHHGAAPARPWRARGAAGRPRSRRSPRGWRDGVRDAARRGDARTQPRPSAPSQLRAAHRVGRGRRAPRSSRVARTARRHRRAPRSRARSARSSTFASSAGRGWCGAAGGVERVVAALAALRRRSVLSLSCAEANAPRGSRSTSSRKPAIRVRRDLVADGAYARRAAARCRRASARSAARSSRAARRSGRSRPRPRSRSAGCRDASSVRRRERRGRVVAAQPALERGTRAPARSGTSRRAPKPPNSGSSKRGELAPPRRRAPARSGSVAGRGSGRAAQRLRAPRPRRLDLVAAVASTPRAIASSTCRNDGTPPHRPRREVGAGEERRPVGRREHRRAASRGCWVNALAAAR